MDTSSTSATPRESLMHTPLSFRTTALLSCLLSACASQAFAQEPPAGRAASSQERAYMAAMMKAMTPGAPHRVLASMAGEWNVKTKMWMEGAPPMESTGTATNTMIMEGRYLQSSFRGAMMGMMFEGVGLTAFDNTTGQYQSVWLDNMSTMLMYATGAYDPATKTMTLRTEMNDLLDPSIKVAVREVITIVDADTHTMEMFETRAGKESKSLEITYTRKR